MEYLLCILPISLILWLMIGDIVNDRRNARRYQEYIDSIKVGDIFEPNFVEDLNDDPFNNSCAIVMGAKKTREEVVEQGFFNTMWQKLDRGIGSLAYQGSWNLFDQIFISEPLMNAIIDDGKWVYWKSQIFNKPFLTVQEGKDKGTPFRTVKSGVWQNGYADHYPTMIYLIKKK